MSVWGAEGLSIGHRNQSLGVKKVIETKILWTLKTSQWAPHLHLPKHPSSTMLWFPFHSVLKELSFSMVWGQETTDLFFKKGNHFLKRNLDPFLKDERENFHTRLNMTMVFPVEFRIPEERQWHKPNLCLFHPRLVLFWVQCWEEKLRRLENPGIEAITLSSGLLGWPPLT